MLAVGAVFAKEVADKVTGTAIAVAVVARIFAGEEVVDKVARAAVTVTMTVAIAIAVVARVLAGEEVADKVAAVAGAGAGAATLARGPVARGRAVVRRRAVLAARRGGKALGEAFWEEGHVDPAGFCCVCVCMSVCSRCREQLAS